MAVAKLGGMRGFFVLWLGQAFSILGGSMALFAITLWIYQRTGQATPVAMLGFFNLMPTLLFGLFTGVLVDRHDRRLMMLLSDLATLAINLFLIGFAVSGSLAVWQLYAAAFVVGTFQTFQWPATSAAVTLMVDKKHYARAASLLEMAGMSSGVVAPLLAGSLLGFLGLGGVLAVTATGSALSVASLFLIDLPARAPHEGPRPRILSEVRDGLAYLLERPPLIGLQSTFLLGNFFFTLSYALLGPMILAKTGNNAISFASVETAGAVGGLVGSGLIALLGGTKNRVLGILLGWVGSGLGGLLIIGLGRGLQLWMLGSFLGAALGSLNYASNQALWQSKVAPDLQGRVFAVRRLIATGVIPLASLAAGPLADRLLEPAMREGGSLVGLLGPVFGVGPGSGIAIIFACCGIATALVGSLAWFVPVIRRAESLIPDHDAPRIQSP
ncbi:MAG TPA: MFS transporter [Rectinemataceae bacterium]|nr:MFS transporter [Rectinemataceae bacterium]